METIRSKYKGGLRTEAIHVHSRNALITDAPTDNQGKGETFSPTDLLSASLGSCMLTVMGIRANDNNLNIEGTSIKTTKIMAANPRRVSEIVIEFNIPHSYNDNDRNLLEDAALNCPVAKSLHANIKQSVSFNYSV